jgi:uncharacterized damage-inducible protein DinB
VEDLRYPIGAFVRPSVLSPSDRTEAIDQIEAAPGRLRDAVEGLSDEQLDTPYRPEGWTVRQVVHHLPDSHMNAFVRFKLALTEDVPTIRTYEQSRWALLPDASGPPDMSLDLMDGIHPRWVYLLRRIETDEWERTFRHPEMGLMDLNELLALYAWHGRHHVAHITALKERMAW